MMFPNLVSRLREGLAPLRCDVDDYPNNPLAGWDPNRNPMKIPLRDELGPCGLVIVRPCNDDEEEVDLYVVDDALLTMKFGRERQALLRVIHEAVNGPN